MRKKPCLFHGSEGCILNGDGCRIPIDDAEVEAFFGYRLNSSGMEKMKQEFLRIKTISGSEVPFTRWFDPTIRLYVSGGYKRYDENFDWEELSEREYENIYFGATKYEDIPRYGPFVDYYDIDVILGIRLGTDLYKNGLTTENFEHDIPSPRDILTNINGEDDLLTETDLEPPKIFFRYNVDLEHVW